VPITVLINTLAIGVSGLQSAEVRLAASAHNVANLTTDGFRPVRTIQADVVAGGSTARVDQTRNPAEVDLVRETVERSRASLQYTASLRLVAIDIDLRGQLADVLV
jgi:flagellar hook protein FlgE